MALVDWGGWDAQVQEAIEDHARAGSEVALGLLTYGPIMGGVERTWDGGGADNNINTAGNWSGDTVPGATDDALYNGTSTKDCTVNVNKTLHFLTMTAAYTGTMTYSATISLAGDAGGFNILGGTHTSGIGVGIGLSLGIGDTMQVTSSANVTLDIITWAGPSSGTATVNQNSVLKARFIDNIVGANVAEWVTNGFDITVAVFRWGTGTVTAGATTWIMQTVVIQAPIWARSGGTFNKGTSTVRFSNDGTFRGGGSANFSEFYNLTIDSGVTATQTNVNTGSTRTLTLNGTMACATFIYRVTNTDSGNGSPFEVGPSGVVTGTGTLQLRIDVASSWGGGSHTISNVSVDVANAGNTPTITLTGNLTLTGAYAQAGTTVALGTATWDQDGTWAVTGGGINISSGTLKLGNTITLTGTITGSKTCTLHLDRAGVQTWPKSVTLSSVLFQGSGTKTVSDNMRCQNDVTIDAGVAVDVASGKYICYNGVFTENGSHTGTIDVCCSVVLSAPAEGARLRKGRPATVTWAGSGVDTPIVVDLDGSYDGGSSFEVIAADQAEDGSTTWRPKRIAPQGRVKATATGSGDVTATDTNNVSIRPSTLGAIGDRKPFSQSIGEDKSHGGI